MKRREAGRQRATALRVWLIGASAFALAVGYRTVLGAAGGGAALRFGLNATQLATLTALHLVVYLVLQVPAGVMLDRFGPKLMLLCGLGTMSSAQLLFAVAHSFPCALVARVILASGDVVIFISVLRLIASWFPGGHIPLMNQLATAVGIGFGSIASTVPLSAALQAFGWKTTFMISALAGTALVAVVAAGVRNRPDHAGIAGPKGPKGPKRRREASPARWLRALRDTWREPGTRLGFWVHFACLFPGNAFVLLWGFPFLTKGHGYSPGTALRLLMLIAGSAVVLGPVIGQTIGRAPGARLPLALGIPTATALTLAAVIGWPGRSPLWLAIVLGVMLGASNPASLIGMEYARLHNPPGRLGVACSIVTIGGYSGTAIAVLGAGYIVDALSAGVVAHRAAIALFLPMLAIGVWKVFRWHRMVGHSCPTACLARHEQEIDAFESQTGTDRLHEGVADRVDELVHGRAVHVLRLEDETMNAEFGVSADRVPIHRPGWRRDSQLELA